MGAGGSVGGAFDARGAGDGDELYDGDEMYDGDEDEPPPKAKRQRGERGRAGRKQKMTGNQREDERARGAGGATSG